MPAPAATYRVYDLTLATDVPLTSFLHPAEGPPDVTYTRSDAPLEGAFWDGAERAYVSPFDNEAGESDYQVFRSPSHGDLLRYPGVVDYYVREDRIHCHLRDPRRVPITEILLLGHVLAFYLERAGRPVLHASGVVVDGHAVGFLAHGRSGKSSLAATLMQGGHPLLTDDLLPLRVDDGEPVALPGYPQMRLWPDQAEHFAEHFADRVDDLPLVHPAVTKRRVPVGGDGLGAFCAEAQPLAALYLPRRRPDDDPDPAVVIEPASPLESVKEMVRHTFMPRTVEALGWQPGRLGQFGRVARHAPVRRLSYPNGVEHLPRVCEAILDDLAAS